MPKLVIPLQLSRQHQCVSDVQHTISVLGEEKELQLFLWLCHCGDRQLALNCAQLKRNTLCRDTSVGALVNAIESTKKPFLVCVVQPTNQRESLRLDILLPFAALLQHQYDTVLEIESLHVINYGNQDLTCAAHTHHLNPPELSRTFRLKMKGSKKFKILLIETSSSGCYSHYYILIALKRRSYLSCGSFFLIPVKPSFECNETQLIHMYQKGAAISCIVHGIPPPDKFKW